MDFDSFRTVSWKTNLCAGGYVVCKIVGAFVPGIDTACGVLETMFVAGGFLSASDGARVQNVVQAVDQLLASGKAYMAPDPHPSVPPPVPTLSVP